MNIDHVVQIWEEIADEVVFDPRFPLHWLLEQALHDFQISDMVSLSVK